MINKNKIVENIDSIETDYTTYKKIKGTLEPTTKVKITGDKPTTSSSTSVTPSISSYPVSEEEKIKPQDKATIKYLSNIRDSKTNEISKPFSINGKNYQMVRGQLPTKEVVMGVYCHDDLNENGENIIHSVDDFDRDIATPIKEMEIEGSREDNYEGYNHYFVIKKSNNIRKFKNIKELVSQHKLDEEDYMGVKEFKQYMSERLFGSRKKKTSSVMESKILTKNELIERIKLKNNE